MFLLLAVKRSVNDDSADASPGEGMPMLTPMLLNNRCKRWCWVADAAANIDADYDDATTLWMPPLTCRIPTRLPMKEEEGGWLLLLIVLPDAATDNADGANNDSVSNVPLVFVSAWMLRTSTPRKKKKQMAVFDDFNIMKKMMAFFDDPTISK
jgi:hypothetical protein